MSDEIYQLTLGTFFKLKDVICAYFRLPDWAEEAIKPNGPMEFIAQVNYKMRGVPALARIKSGFLIKEILEHFSKKMSATLEPNRRLWLYSGHSTTITTMLNGLGFSQVIY